MLLVVFGLAAPATAQPLTHVVIATVPTIASTSTYIADAKGYLRDAGIDAEIQNIDSVSTAMPLLASGRIQVAQGGLAASYWNGVAQGLPVIMAFEGGSTPLNHHILLGLGAKDKIKAIADLKGHAVALNAPGSIIGYDLYKVLGSAGLTFNDVDIKYISFPQMGIALQNGAVDAAVDVPPFGDLIIAKGLGVNWINTDDYLKPAPVTVVHYVINSDWAKANSDLAHRLFVAIGRGTRDYCQAYHHGPNRDEVIAIMLKYGVAGTHDSLDKFPWQARDPNGRFNMASLLDVQDWYFKDGFIKQKLTPRQLVDPSYADAAAKALGPFAVTNTASTLRGCR
ncbi:MAG TPA: ABC transporter substrate-binding protein [Stellaceae bacterium]|nr:ABC transporter substrate-binding protein [Stellaceae bacterium]